MANDIVASTLAGISAWVDHANRHRDPEAQTWGRLAKLTEEAGEVVAAYIGWLGANPRKGVTATEDDVVQELLDVAVTALAAVEHVTGNRGRSLTMLEVKILSTGQRVGVTGR